MDAGARVRQLGLEPHPEGGFFREVVRSEAGLQHPVHGEGRAALTSIYYLLPPATFSALHRVVSDELWVHLEGDPVELHLITEGGAHTVRRLGRDLAAGEVMQWAVGAGVWQAAAPVGAQGALCACAVAPGFDFADFEMPPREALLRRFPDLSDVVTRLTRP